jgi:hypothetical protein
MMAQLQLEKILPPECVVLFWQAFDELVSHGADRIVIPRDSKVGAQLLTPEEAKDQLTRRLASQWAAHPETLERIRESFEEKPKKW